MLTKTLTTNTAEFREESGTYPERIDSQLLSGAACIASEAARDLLASRGRDDWITLFSALAELTCVHSEAGDPQPCFSTATLREKCAELDPPHRVYWLSEEDTGRKKFSKAWEKLEASFSGLTANLQQRAEKKRVAARVSPYSKSDEQDKRTKLFGFQLIEINLPESNETLGSTTVDSRNASLSANMIEYVEEMEIFPIPGIRRPLRINVQGWRSLFMIMPLLITLAISCFGIWVLIQLWLSDIPLRKVFQGTLTLGIFISVFVWLAWPFYRLVEDRIISAPGFLELNSLFQHVLLIKKEEQVKVIRMVRFTGTCPMCGGLVEVNKGRGLFRGRFVGMCERNPIEHIFSFDHILRRGRWLRS